MKKRVVWYLTGLSCSGKSVLLRRLKKAGFKVVDTSDLLIRRARNFPEDREHIHGAMLTGGAVSDEIVNNAVADVLALDPNSDYVIAGYPRTTGQAQHAVEVFGPHQEQHFIYLYLREKICRLRFEVSLGKSDRGERLDGDHLESAEERFNRDAINIPLTMEYLDGCKLRGYFHEITGELPEEEVFHQMSEIMKLSQSVLAS
jgi:adenylate kinase family enzyme